MQPDPRRAAADARDRADELRRRREAAAGGARRRGRLPAEERAAAGGRPRDPRRARGRGGDRPEGRRPAPRRARRDPAGHARRSPRASARCSRCLCRGLSNKRIARELGLSEKTVKTHVGHIFAKLGVTDRTQAALLAVREGLSRVLKVLGPMSDCGRVPAGAYRGRRCRPQSSPALRRASGSRSRASSRAGKWRLVIDARGADALEAARAELAELTEVVAIRGDVADGQHRLAARSRRPATGCALLVNNASVLGPSPQPSARRLPARRARARVRGQRDGAARADPARAARAARPAAGS